MTLQEVIKSLDELSVEEQVSLFDVLRQRLTVIHELLYGCLRLPAESKKRAFLLDYIEQIPVLRYLPC